MNPPPPPTPTHHTPAEHTRAPTTRETHIAPEASLTARSASSVLTLAIENANPSSLAGVGPLGPASVALGWIDVTGAGATVSVLAGEPIAPSSRETDDLIGAIDRCCARAGVSPSQIRRVVVDIGPGGYTALRMAVASAKMIALVGGAGCVGVPAASVAMESLHLALQSDAPAGPVVVVLATKGESAFVTRFGRGAPEGDGSPAFLPDDGRVMTWAEVCAIRDLARGVLLMDEHVPKHWRQEAAALGVTVHAPRFDAVSLLHAGARLAGDGGRSMDAAMLLPLYAREPEAVTIWRERKLNAKT